jgi:hypothetical protein
MYKTDAPDITNFGIDVSGNYFITNNLAIGLGLGYTYYKCDNNADVIVWARNPGLGYTYYKCDNSNGYDPNYGIFSVVPQLHYVTRLTDRISWTPGLYLAFGFGSADDYYVIHNSGEQKSNYFGFRGEIRPLSFDFHATRNIAINFTAGSLYYNMTKWSGDNSSDNYVSDHTFGLSLNNGFTFGFRYYL